MPNAHPVEMTFSANAAALVLQPGSLVASFALEGGVKGYGWIVAVVAKSKRLLGRTAQPAAKRLVDGAREQAEQRAVYVFPRLDQLRPAERQHLQTRPLVLVFLHGLFATDLGTFDGLISRLRAANPLVLWRTMQDLAAKPPDGPGRPPKRARRVGRTAGSPRGRVPEGTAQES